MVYGMFLITYELLLTGILLQYLGLIIYMYRNVSQFFNVLFFIDRHYFILIIHHTHYLLFMIIEYEQKHW